MSLSTFLRKNLINYESEKAFSFKLRQKRSARIKQLIIDVYDQYGGVNIIDIGGLDLYWRIVPRKFLEDHKVHITCVNVPGVEITDRHDPMFTFATGDGCNLEGFADKSFHIAHSNSVIEHVGDNGRKQMFAKEINRVGEHYYVQTPDFWFPMEPHFMMLFFHWFPKFIRIFLLRNLKLNSREKNRTYEWAKNRIEHTDLLTASQMKKYFPGSKLYHERIFLLSKSLIVIK